MPKQGLTYYEAKPVAQAALGRLFDSNDPRVVTGDVQFEPDHGFVVVVVVEKLAGTEDLAAAGFDVQVLGVRPGTSAPAPKAPKPPAPAREGAVSAPSKGATARVWEIADRVVGDGPWSRADVIGACVAEGINSATAATQYSKWKKARGL